MEVKADNCDNCYNRHITSVAVKWCSNCDEALCSVCTEHHQASKLLKSHPIIPISDYHKLPYYIREVETCCQNHEEPFQLYCQTHEQCCCVLCVKETHSECKDIEALRCVVKDVKSSPALEDVGNGLKQIISFYDSIRENRAQNKSRLAEQKDNFIAEVHTIRKSINDHLDDLVNSIEKTISTEFEAANSQIEEVLNEVEERQKKMCKLIEEEETIKQLSTDLQTFLGLQFFQDHIKEETEYIENLKKEQKIDELNLVFQSSAIYYFREQNESIGTVSITQSLSLIDFNVGKKERAQIILPRIVVTDKVVSNICHIRYPRRDSSIQISGCTILPTGQIIFVDYFNSQVLMRNVWSNPNSDYRDIIHLQNAMDVALIDSRKVAVTSENDIVIIDLLMGEILKTFSPGVGCMGIEFIHGHFIVRCKGVFLKVDAETGEIVQRIESNCLTCVTAAADKIYGCQHAKGIIWCLSDNGEMIWQFQDEKLKYPRDLTTDDQGFVYVTGQESNNVIVISPDGKTCKEILNQSDGLNNPMAIHFEKTLGLLLVCNEKHGAVIGTIK